MEPRLSESEIAQRIAQKLLEIRAIQLNLKKPFTWSSGWRTPIYCDNRLSLSYPEIRNFIKRAFISKTQELYPEAQAIAAVATAGIPHGALIANDLELPLVYVRSKPKDHGMTNQIEGKVVPGRQVVVIEDLVSTGGSSLSACQVLRESGMAVLGMLSIFTYEFELAANNFKQAGVELHSLSNYTHLIHEAMDQGYIQQEELDSLTRWRANPANWTP